MEDLFFCPGRCLIPKPSTIEAAILAEAQKLIKRHEAYASRLAEDIRRKEDRSGSTVPKVVLRPAHWSTDRGFDPYYVRSKASSIARSIEKSLQSHTYSPRPAYEYEVPKPDGGVRKVSVFQIADSALSTLTFKNLMQKNARHLSANAYAYRTDLSLHDAVLHIAADLKRRSRFFVAEFDFAAFFDSISHTHLIQMLLDKRFFVTQRELAVLRAFLRTPSLGAASYHVNPRPIRTVGIPQGTSVSLFLANLAAHPLDKRLERLGVGFARFADDTLIWSDSYVDIGRAANALEEAAAEMGVTLNRLKSRGVSLLSPAGMPKEISGQDALEFLGHSISQSVISIREKKIKAIKKHISFLIYSNLLQEPKRGHTLGGRMLGPVDRDYRILVYQLRRYLYGGLSEAKLRRYLTRQTPLVRYKGLMSFYPVVDDVAQLSALDGWMLGTVSRALRLRRKLYQNGGYHAGPAPHGMTDAQLLELRIPRPGGTLEDLRFPSFRRVSNLIQRASTTYGASAIANVQSGRYYSA